MECLRSKAISIVPKLLTTSSPETQLRMCHLNTNGFLNHLHDIQLDPAIQNTDIMCFRETHLRSSVTLHSNQLPWQEAFVHRFDHKNNILKGGILITARMKTNPQQLIINNQQVECATISIRLSLDSKIIIITIYRQERTVTVRQCISALQTIIEDFQHEEIIIVRDFNDEARSSITRELSALGFVEHFVNPTTDHGTTTDHVYYNRNDAQTQSEVVNMTYSDHDLTAFIIDL